MTAAGRARTVRVFLSSTFRDFGEERDLLVRQVFPALRAHLRDRFVELVDVDLRWGITVEQAERGEVLPICLDEIERSRPYFIGMLGERYGWVPPPGAITPELLQQQPWLAEHAGGTSVTEMEILHGVLNNPALAGHAFFYFRSPAYARRKGGDYLQGQREDRLRQVRLKCRIRRSGFPVVRYERPEDLAARIGQDLWQLLDAQFPAGDAPTPAERAWRQHEAYAAPRRALHIGGLSLLAALDEAVARGEARVLVEGASGGGKSALLANWAHRHQQAHPQAPVLAHYLAASSDAASPQDLVRRVIEFIQHTTGFADEIPDAQQALFDSLGSWLARAGEWAQARGVRWVFLFDGLNGLRNGKDLLWFPAFLPPRVHVLVSCLPGKVRGALKRKGPWHRLEVLPLDGPQRRELLVAYLAPFKKELPEPLVQRVLDHPLAGNPLFLRTLAEELRLFGVHEVLAQRVDHYLASDRIEDLFDRVLERLEHDFGGADVATVMRVLGCSRAGLREDELLTGRRPGLTPLVHATWAPLRHALDGHLIESMGRLAFAHDYLRAAVDRRYLQAPGEPAVTHRRLADWFAQEPMERRRSFEQPYQLLQAQDWPALQACLTGREMFRAVHRDRGQQELLSQWLLLTRATGLALHEAYLAVWPHWQVGDPQDVVDGAMRLQRFLAFAGHTGAFAVEVARRTLDLVRALHGTGHPQAIEVLQRLAALMRARGDLAQAEALYEQARGLVAQVHGEASSEMGDILSRLAQVHGAQGRYAQAEALARRALALQEATKGPQEMATWSALNTLSTILREQRRFREAVPLQTRALAIVQRRRGREHRDTATALAHVASLFMDLGQKDEAGRGFRKVLAMREKLLGPTHDLTATARNNLARWHKSMGQTDEARALYGSALELFELQFGRRHARTATVMSNLGILLAETGERERGLALLQESLEIREAVLGPQHPAVATSLGHLASLHHQQGEHALALPFRERELALREQVQGSSHADTRGAMNALGRLLDDMGDLARAEAVCLRLLALREQALGVDSPRVADVRERLVSIYERLGRPQEAARYRSSAPGPATP